MKRIIFRIKNENDYIYATVNGEKSKNFIVPKGPHFRDFHLKFVFSTRYAIWVNMGFDNSQFNGEGA